MQLPGSTSMLAVLTIPMKQQCPLSCSFCKRTAFNQLIECSPFTDMLVNTSLPLDNYCYNGSLTNNGVTLLLSVN